MFLGLSLLTFLFLIPLSVQDLKERMIYAFPVQILVVSWGIYSALLYKDEPGMYVKCISLSVILFLIFNLLKIWGDGDSDVFLLGVTILLSVFRMVSVRFFLISICIMVIFSLLFSFAVGLIESLFKKEKLSKESALAVVPGFSITFLSILIFKLGGFV